MLLNEYTQSVTKQITATQSVTKSKEGILIAVWTQYNNIIYQASVLCKGLNHATGSSFLVIYSCVIQRLIH